MTPPGDDGDIGRIPDADWISAGFRWSTGATSSRARSGRGKRASAIIAAFDAAVREAEAATR